MVALTYRRKSRSLGRADPRSGRNTILCKSVKVFSGDLRLEQVKKTIAVRLVSNVVCKLKDVYKPPFSTIGQALNRYNSNPARAKYINFFEQERYQRTHYHEMDQDHPDRIWARIVRGLQKVLHDYRPTQRLAWCMCNLGDKTDDQKHPDVVAAKIGVHPSTVYRWLKRIDDDMQDEFIQRRLIPDPTRESDHGNRKQTN